MATNLDLQEQEQLDALKAFWKQYGNLITWTVILALLAFAGWRYWQHRQAQQGLEAGAMYEELDRAVDAADLDRTARVLADLQQRFPKTAFAAQGALLAARLQAEKGQADAAKASLGWLLSTVEDVDFQAMARLRLAVVLADAGQHDEALKTLDAPLPAPYEALQADRRGDVLALKGDKPGALAAYQRAYAAMSEQVGYRGLIEAKMGALGAPPPAAAASGASR
jgi:predicted negative regulator of RcsB-dependent stress response